MNISVLTNDKQFADKGVQEAPQKGPKAKSGKGSFAVPRVVCEALLDSQASALEICAYLVLAKSTDASGQYSTASVTAINRATGSNKAQGGAICKAIEKLTKIHAKRIVRKPSAEGENRETTEEIIDLGPILVPRAVWQAQTGELLPDGNHPRAKITYVLPDFGETLAERVWFGNSIVQPDGNNSKFHPLQKLKKAGDVAARLLIYMYMADDMGTWGGVSPIGRYPGPWHYFKNVADDVYFSGGGRLIRAKEHQCVLPTDPRIAGENREAIRSALSWLESKGFAYQVILVLDRDDPSSHAHQIVASVGLDPSAEPLYTLDTRSLHGPRAIGEDGLSSATAKTAGQLGYSVANWKGEFDGTFAAIVHHGQGAMIAGIYRLRCRVTNPRNYGVSEAWRRIARANEDGFEDINRIRRINNLEPLESPIRTQNDRAVMDSSSQGAVH